MNKYFVLCILAGEVIKPLNATKFIKVVKHRTWHLLLPFIWLGVFIILPAFIHLLPTNNPRQRYQTNLQSSKNRNIKIASAYIKLSCKTVCEEWEYWILLKVSYINIIIIIAPQKHL